ncbi:MAG: hypothetical protein IPL04_15505 [Chitinophagaceae bacterium]|nr:hypothetical protein [Chitinophagaceae bacterium]
MARPDLSTAPEWFHGYINAVKENDLTDALRNQAALFNTFLSIQLKKEIPLC